MNWNCWEALSYRKYIKQILTRSFKHVCRPFECSPQQVTSPHIEGGNNVWGVAVLNKELYVSCRGSNIIQVFDSRPPFNRHGDNKVQGLKDASDIAVCSKLSQVEIFFGLSCMVRFFIKSIEAYFSHIILELIFLGIFKEKLLDTCATTHSCWLNSINIHLAIPSNQSAQIGNCVTYIAFKLFTR